MMRGKTLILTAAIAVGVAMTGPASAEASTQARGAVSGHSSSSRDRGPSTNQADSTNWTGFLYSNGHGDDASDDDAVTTSNAGSLTQAWDFIPGTPPNKNLTNQLLSSPTVYDGVIYIGANNGTFYALDESTGAIIWSDFIGYEKKLSCRAQGFAATAAVDTDPVTNVLTVYINAPDGYLYALNAATGATIWRSVVALPSTTQNSYYAYSSPTVANSTVYVGVASLCSHPFVRGGELAFDQDSGALTASRYNVPTGDVGGGVWSTPAVDAGGTVYISTGSAPYTNQLLGSSESILALNPTTLAPISQWQAPNPLNGDEDFGASPTIFSAVLQGQTQPTELVGACNKSGVFYALKADDLAAGPVWEFSVGPTRSTKGSLTYSCTSSGAWNGTDLFLADPGTMIDNVHYKGGIWEIDPSTGKKIWGTGLPAGVQGAPTLDGANVLAVATFNFSGEPNAVYLLNATTGAILATLNNGNSSEFAGPVFAGPYIFLATVSSGLIAYEVPGT